MPDSYVTSAQIKDKKLDISVQVDDFKPGDYVEVSGQATQVTGAFANFYDIQQVPPEPNEPGPDGVKHYYIHVTGAPIPHEFRNDRDVTIVLRAARVWLTVLGPNTKLGLPKGADGATWDENPKVAPLTSGSLPEPQPWPQPQS